MDEEKAQQHDAQELDQNQEELQHVKEADAQAPSSSALEEKIKQLEEEQLRIYADFENFKKRLAREKDQALEYAYEKFAKDLLASVDTLELALNTIRKAAQEAQDKESFEKIEEGISLTLDNLLKALNKHGIEVIDTSGEFDPNIHDAIMQVESKEHQAGQIVAEMQKGYTYKQRVLRPSMVSIAK